MYIVNTCVRNSIYLGFFPRPADPQRVYTATGTLALLYKNFYPYVPSPKYYNYYFGTSTNYTNDCQKFGGLVDRLLPKTIWVSRPHALTNVLGRQTNIALTNFLGR